MANVKITDMTPGSALTGTESFEMVQSSATRSTTAAAIRTYIQSAPMDFVGGTVTASDPVISAIQTWNAGAVTFTGWKLNITNTTSAAASMLVDLQVGGVSQFNVTKGGLITATGGLAIAGPVTGATTGAFSGSITFSVASAGITLKQGANGRVGTFTANGATPVSVANSSIAISDAIVISLNTVGGTVGVQPHVATITAGVGFDVVCTAGDSSIYNYCVIKNAA